jgi:hypothetical protein
MPGIRFSLAQLKSVHVQFNASHAASCAVREFLARVSAPKTVETNPKCEMTYRLRLDNQPPVVAVEFINGFKDIINCRTLTCQQIMQTVQQRSEELDTQAVLTAAGLKGLTLDGVSPRRPTPPPVNRRPSVAA